MIIDWSVGFALLSHVGELAVYDFYIESDDLKEQVVIEEKTATLSLRGGGSMPYSLSYGLKRYGNVMYLTYKLDGGVQYRNTDYPDAPRHTGQYSVEIDHIKNPYIALYDGDCKTPFEKYIIYNGELSTADPGLWWNVLRSYFGIVELPIDGMLPINNNDVLMQALSGHRLQISFGYDEKETCGYHMQKEYDIEAVYDFDTAKVLYEGKARHVEAILISSHSQATLDIIPKTVYDYEKVIHHLETNHFFAEGEEIAFSASVQTERDTKFVSLTAELKCIRRHAFIDGVELRIKVTVFRILRFQSVFTV